MANTKKTSLRSVIQRSGWPPWAVLLLVVVLLIEIILICGSASLFNLIIPFATGLERPPVSGRVQNAVHTLAFSPGGNLLATGTEDGQVRLWEAVDGTLLQTLDMPGGAVTDLAFSVSASAGVSSTGIIDSEARTETRLAAGSRAGIVQIWRVSDGRPLHTLRHAHAVRSIAFSPDGLTLAVGDWGGMVHLWSAQEGLLLTHFEAHTDWVSQVAFSPDGALLATGSNDGTARLWDPLTGQLLYILPHPPEPVLHLVFAPHRPVLATASLMSDIHLWQIAESDGVHLRTLSQNGPIWRLAFSPDGRYLAVGGEGQVDLWSVEDEALGQSADMQRETVAQSTILKREKLGAILSLAFSPDGTILAAGSRDGQVHLLAVMNRGETIARWVID